MGDKITTICCSDGFVMYVGIECKDVENSHFVNSLFFSFLTQILLLRIVMGKGRERAPV